MTFTVSDYVLKRLQRWGVSQIYGYPGDGIHGLLGALGRAEGVVRFVPTPHEELAALMATAHAKFTGGQVGVCMATSGPGAIHLLNGLYDAAMDHQPVVAIIGQQARSGLGANVQQEVDLPALFQDVARAFCHTCVHPAQARHLVDRAIRIALGEKTVTCVIVPSDVQEEPAVEPPSRAQGSVRSGVGWLPPAVVPHGRDLAYAARVLNEGRRVAILVGQGALKAGPLVEEVAERLGAGVAKTVLGKAVLPDDLPYVTGAIGLLGTRASDWMMQHCDTLFMIGSGFPYSEWLPKEGQARGVQIDLKPRMLSLRYPMEVPLCGDTELTLAALLPLLDRKEDRAWRARIEREVTRWWAVLEARALASASRPDLLNPQRVFWALSPRLPDHAILTADSGTATGWWARDLKLRRGMMASLSGNLATMGPGLPYALAAKMVHPDRPVIACVGDGAMQMNGLNTLLSVARHWEEWADPRLVVLVLHNGDLGQVTWSQRMHAGEARNPSAQDLFEVSYARYAEQLGLRGIEMRSADDVARGWREALEADRPVVVDAHTDPEVPALPPHIRPEMARRYLAALVKDDAHRWREVTQSAKELWGGVRGTARIWGDLAPTRRTTG